MTKAGFADDIASSLINNGIGFIFHCLFKNGSSTSGGCRLVGINCQMAGSDDTLVVPAYRLWLGFLGVKIFTVNLAWWCKDGGFALNDGIIKIAMYRGAWLAGSVHGVVVQMTA